jgi:hypothetical protein
MFWYSADSGVLSNISRIASFGVMLPFMIYGLALGLRKIAESEERFLGRLASPHALLMTFVVVYSGVHILTWTLIRYRLPVDAVLVPFAALALVDLAGRIWQPRPIMIRR